MPLGNKVKVHIVILDDDDHSHGEKTVNLNKISNNGDKSRVLATKFTINGGKFFGPGDVSACSYLIFDGTKSDTCVRPVNGKVKSNELKEVTDYGDLWATVGEGTVLQ